MSDDNGNVTRRADGRELLAELEAAVAKKPADGEAWGRLAQAYWDEEAFDLAGTAYEQAALFEPDVAFHWQGLAAAYLVLGEPQKALAPARRAVELEPRRAARRLVLASVLGRLGMAREAIVHLEAGLSLDSRWPRLHAQLGYARLALDDFGAAREAFETALSLDPEQLAVWPHLGYCLLRLERWKPAAHVLETAVFLQPQEGLQWARLGSSYRCLGRADDAARALARSLELGYVEPWVWYESGEAAAALGDREALEKAYEAVKGRDAELTRRLEAHLRELAEPAGASEAPRPEPAADHPRDAEAPSC